MIYGHTPSLARGHKAMAHRTGFTARTLHKQLTLAGFAPIQVSQTGSFDLKAVAHKPAVHRSTAQGPTADKLAVEAAVGRQAAD
ncbi:MAG: hypothetical protein JO267_12350 [Alphaproteobacteria bacterium]|nr:hypothetical protein [Alphaproteobacteria bacterium]